MATILTDAEYDEQWEEWSQTADLQEFIYEDDREFLYQGHNLFARNIYDWTLQLRDGLGLRVWSFEPTEDLLIPGTEDLDDPLNLSFFVSGTMHTQLHGVTDTVDEAAGGSYLQYCPGIRETEGWTAHQKILRVKVLIEPVFFRGMDASQFEGLPPELKQFAIQAEIQPFYRQGIITTEIQQVLQQVLHCPYQGMMKSLYLEAKALELMALQLSQLQTYPIKATPSLKATDIDRIHQAKEILRERLDNPPSLIDLARLVGLNDCTLKRGFRQVLGTTAFGYLHQQRLEMARQLLDTGTLKVAEVSQAVGFANRNYFTGVFKQKFGLTPSDYRLQRKNSVYWCKKIPSTGGCDRSD